MFISIASFLGSRRAISVPAWIFLFSRLSVPSAFSQRAPTNEVIIKLKPSVAIEKHASGRIEILNNNIAAALQYAGNYHAQPALPEGFRTDESEYVLLRFTTPPRDLSEVISYYNAAVAGLPDLLQGF